MIQIGMVKDQSDIFNLSLDASKHCNVGRYLNSCSQPKSKRRNCEITMGLMEYQNQIEMRNQVKIGAHMVVWSRLLVK